MKNYILGLYNKVSSWLDTFVDKQWWEKLILIVCSMAVMFGITVLVCFLLKELIWVLGVIVAIATGIFIYCRIKGEKRG